MSEANQNSFPSLPASALPAFEQKDQFINALRSSLSELEYNIWLSDLNFELHKHENEQKLIICTNSEFKKEKIEERYVALLKKLASTYFKASKLEVTLAIKEDYPTSSVSQSNMYNSGSNPDSSLNKFNHSSSQTAVANQLISSNPNALTDENSNHTKKSITGSSKDSSKKTLENNATLSQGRRILGENTLQHFIELPENHLALSFVKKALDRPGAINPIYIYGQVGVGKTHLLHAFANAFQKNAPFSQVEYLTPDDFVTDFTQALITKTDRDFRIRYRSVDALLIDDIQFFMGKEKSSVEFFHVFNAIHASGRQMIFTSDKDPRELESLDNRLKSRLSSSAIIEIKAPALESRYRLIEKYLQREKLELHEEVKTYLARRLTGDIRQLVGAIRYLSALASMGGDTFPPISAGAAKELGYTIDVAFCEEHLKQLPKKRVDWSEHTKVHPEKIFAAISQVSGIPLKDFKARKKSKHISHYRQIAMYLLRRYTDLSFPEIGFSLGGRSTTAVIYGVDKVTESLASEKSQHQNHLQEQIDEVLTKVAKISVF